MLGANPYFLTSALLLLSLRCSAQPLDLKPLHLPSCHPTLISSHVQLTPNAKSDAVEPAPLLIFDVPFIESTAHLPATLVKSSTPTVVVFVSADEMRHSCDDLVRPLIRYGHIVIPNIPSLGIEDFESRLHDALFIFESCTGFIQPFYSRSTRTSDTAFPLFLIEQVEHANSTLTFRNQAALDRLSTIDAKQGIVRIFDDRQLHCLYDRLGCDLVAKYELLFAMCKSLREEYFKRRKVDLFKFAPKKQGSHWTDSDFMLTYEGQQNVNSNLETVGVVEQNRKRIDMAFAHISASRRSEAPVGEVLSIVYTLSDAQLNDVANGRVAMSKLLREIGADQRAEDDTVFLDLESDGERFRRRCMLLVATLSILYATIGLVKYLTRNGDRRRHPFCFRSKIADFSKVL